MTSTDVPTSPPAASTRWSRSQVCLILAGIAVGYSALWNDGFISSWGILCLLAAAGASALAASDIVRGRSVPAGWWQAVLWLALSSLIAVNVLVYPGARWSTRERETETSASQTETSRSETQKSARDEQIEDRWASRLGTSRNEARQKTNGRDFEELGHAWALLGWSYSPSSFLAGIGDVIFRESIVFDPTQIAGMAVVCLLALLGLSSRRRLANVSFVAALALYAVLGARWLQKIPDPPIDTFVSQQAACKAVLSGQNPYGTLIPDIYGDRATSYPEWIVKDGKLLVGFFYPPYSLLLALPGYLLTGDHRYSQLAALLIAVLLVGFSTSDRKARFAALIILLNPRNFMYLELGFTDHFVLMGLAAVLFAAIREWKWTGILLGLLLATKPYLVLIVPLVALLEGNRPRLLLQAFLSALAVTLPIALWDFGAFMNGCVLVHLSSPFRKDSLSLPALGVWAGIDWQFMSFMAGFGYLVAALAILLCLGLFRRGTLSFAIASGMTYLAFFLTTKQSFGNYFIPLVGMFGGAGLLRPAAVPVWQEAKVAGPARWWDRLAGRIYRHSWLVQIGRNRLPAIAALSIGLWSLMVANDLNDGFFCPPAILWLTISVAATFLAFDLATGPAPRDLRPLKLHGDTAPGDRDMGGPPISLKSPLRTAVGFVHTITDFLRRHPLIPALIPVLAAGHLYWRFLEGYPGSHWCSPLGSLARQLGFERGELLWEYDPAKFRDRIARVAGLETQLRDSRFLWGFGIVGVLALLTTIGRRRVAAFAFPAALVAYAATGAYWIHAHPNPPNTDAFVLQQDGCAALLRGEKPYSITIPLVFDSGVQPYAPELVKDGRALFGYTYPPVMLFLNLPAYVLTGDHRHAEMLALAITAALLGYMRPGRFPKIVALFYLFCPRSFMIVEVSWTDPIMGMLIALTVFCAIRFPRATPYVFGVLVAAKQYSLFYIPLAVLLVPSGKPRDILTFLVKGGVTGAVLSLPLALLDWPGFMHSAIRLQFLQDWYEWSLGYMAVLWWINVPVPVLHAMKMLPFVLALVFSFYCVRKLPRTPGAFALAICVVYLVFVAFNKQAFLNYYCMVFAAGCCALACGDFVRFQPPLSSTPRLDKLGREAAAPPVRGPVPAFPLSATSTVARS